MLQRSHSCLCNVCSHLLFHISCTSVTCFQVSLCVSQAQAGILSFGFIVISKCDLNVPVGASIRIFLKWDFNDYHRTNFGSIIFPAPRAPENPCALGIQNVLWKISEGTQGREWHSSYVFVFLISAKLTFSSWIHVWCYLCCLSMWQMTRNTLPFLYPFTALMSPWIPFGSAGLCPSSELRHM